MDNLSDSRKNIVLPELQAFLLEKELTQKKNVLCGPACRVFWGGREKLPLTRLAIYLILFTIRPPKVNNAIHYTDGCSDKYGKIQTSEITDYPYNIRTVQMLY